MNEIPYSKDCKVDCHDHHCDDPREHCDYHANETSDQPT